MQISSAIAGVGLLGFWAGLYGASCRYPSAYDWRTMTVSSLLYPDRDPDGFTFAWVGVLACAGGGLCWVFALLRNERFSRHGRNRTLRPGLWSLALGYLSMVGCASWPGTMLHLPRGHDLLAWLAFAAIGAGTVQLSYAFTERRLRGRERMSRGHARLRAAAIAAMALCPLLLVAFTDADFANAFPHLPWFGAQARAAGVPEYLRFAVWEWTACWVLTAYMLGLVFALAES